MLRKFAPDWRTFLSGCLIVFAFTPWEITPLIWISLVPWFWALRRAESPFAAFVQGVWLSFFMTLGGFYWVAFVLKEFGELPWPPAIAGLLLFALAGQPQFLIFAPIWKKLEKAFSLRNPMGPLGISLVTFLVALIYTGIDWTIPKLFVDTLGHAFYKTRSLRQVADLGGATLLTFLVFLVNDAIWDLIWRLRKRAEPSFWPALKASSVQVAVALVLLVSAFVYGSRRHEEILALQAHPKATVQAGVIQANIGDFDKIASERGIRGAAERVLETFFGLSDKALGMTPKPDFLVWPETSYPSTFRTPQTADELSRDQQVEHFVRDRGVPVLFGGYDHFQNKDYNAFFFLSPRPRSNGKDLEVYRKNVLLLFGEYIPGAEQIKLLRDLFPQVGNFGRGEGPSVLGVDVNKPGLPSVQIGPIICYEALFPNYLIEEARKGAQFILNITNDSWFGPSGEPKLHLSLTTFRSIETRLPQLRSTNTGISTLITADGEITQPTGVGETAIINATIAITEPIPTLMKAWGDWFGPFALLVGALGMTAVLVVRRRA